MADPVDLIKYAFVAGEVSPKLFGRSDLEKYDLALAQATNWFVDYTGGISTRPGTRFCEYVPDSTTVSKFFHFKFAPNVNSTYVVLVGPGYMRFLQDGLYVTEAAKTITAITQSSPGVLTSAAHGFVADDLIKLSDIVGMTELNGRTFLVDSPTANTFRLKDMAGNLIDTLDFSVYGSGGEAARVYTLVSPYGAADLPTLRGRQSRSTITFTHESYDPYVLTRVSHASWTLAKEVRGALVSAVTGLTVTPSGSGSAGVAFIVTAVNLEGDESVYLRPVINKACQDYSDATVGGSVLVTWTGAVGISHYNVYRSRIIADGASLNAGTEFGFVGIAYGPAFVDNNIIPDFTQQPPIHHDPFADGAVDYITVTNGGSGYVDADVVSVTGGSGADFIGYPVVVAGAIAAVVVVAGGLDYSGATVSFTGAGTGAAATATLTETSGNNPRVSGVFQQRKVYAGTSNKPLTVNASKPGMPINFNESIIVQEDDAYEFELDSEDAAPIIHLLSTRSGLVIMSQSTISQLTGGNGVAVTPTNALADPQSKTGSSLLRPLEIDTDVLYQEGKGSTIRLLTYNDFSKVFASQDLSILSNHLIDTHNNLVAWDFASDPHKIVLGVREDGVILGLTLVKEQAVFGWCTWQTNGLFKDIIVLQENDTDVAYVMVERYIDGVYRKYIEEVTHRDFTDVEDAWCVDSGLTLPGTYPAADIEVSASTGTGVIITASAAVFAPGDVGKIIRGVHISGGSSVHANGKALITAYTDSTHVVCTVLRDFTHLLPETEQVLPLEEGDWTMDAEVTAVSGLWHLEGKTVKILADGNVLPDATVTNGGINLSQAASRVTVGLGYRCIARDLPPTTSAGIIEAKRKRTVAVNARVFDTRGLKIGRSLDTLYPFKERTDEAYAEPTRLQQGLKRLPISDSFNAEGQIYFVQEDPLPATLLGFVKEVELGDVSK